MELKAMSRYFRFCAIACLAAFGLAASEHHGVVKFATLPVPGATVTATKGDKKVVAITDENGFYSFPDLEDGTWKLQVDMLTFTSVSKEIGVAPNAPGAEWELKMMSMEEIKPTLQTAAPPSTPPTPAPATSSAAGAPAPGAPASTPAAAPSTAAAAPAANGAAKGKNGKNAPATATPQQGFQRTDVNASADGAALTNSPSIATPPEATQTASDAFVVNGSTSNGIERRVIGNGRKGPRSLFNGGFDVRNFNNDLLDARNYSITGQDIARVPFTQYVAAGSVQGPLWVPHLFRWNGNFYASFQTSRSRTASNSPTVMPTQAERNGDFSQVTNAAGGPVTVLDPTTGNPFPNDMIPSTKISPQAAYLLNFYPQPQFASVGSAYNYEVPIISRNVSDQFTTRINKPLDAQYKNTLNAQFTYVTSHADNPNIFSFLDTTQTRNYGGGGTLNHTFTRLLRGQLTVSYSRSDTQLTPFFANKTNVSGLAGINGNDQSPFDWGPPSIAFGDGSNIATLSDSSPSDTRNQTKNITAQIQYNRRPHNFTVRADYIGQDFSRYNQNNGRGSFTFTGDTPGLQTGLGFASFLLGLPDASNLAFGNADKYFRTNNFDAGIDDDWRVSSSLSLKLGVRWDFSTPITEKYNRLVNLDIAPGFTAAAPVVANQSLVGSLTGTHFSSSLINPEYHEVSPRVGLAWKPIFGSSLLVRAGYGVYYNTSVYNTLANYMSQQSPLSKSLSLANSLGNPLTLANGFIASPSLTPDLYGIDPNFHVGYSQNWYVTLQQNLTPALPITVTYSGVKGTRAVQEFLPNTYPQGAANPCPSCLAGYTYFATNGNSTRESAQIQIRRRFHGGLNAQGQYTFAKAIDDSGGLGGSTAPIAQNWLNLAAERGLSNFDQRHNVQATFSYSTGVGVHGGALLSGWRGFIFKGWTVSGTLSAGSGLPFSPSYISTTVTGNQTVRPEYIGGNVYAGTAGRFLNPAAFNAPPLGQWGDAARDMLIGPNQFSFNMSAARAFQEHLTATFNSTNVLNHPVFASVNGTFNPNLLNGGSFGIFNSPAQGSMRTVTATLRWTF